MVSIFIVFAVSSEKDAPYHHKTFDYSRADWYGFCEDLRDVPWNNTYRYGASKATFEFYELQVGIHRYIPNRIFLVKPHYSSPWFSPSCAAAIGHRNHFFIFIKETNQLVLGLCLDKLVIIIKRLLNFLRIAIPRR